MFRRQVKSISELVTKTLRDNGLETPLLQRRLIESWGRVAGPTIDKYTTEKFIKNQTLFVRISNPALRADLSMMRSRLVKLLNQEVGSMVIVDIRLF